MCEVTLGEVSSVGVLVPYAEVRPNSTLLEAASLVVQVICVVVDVVVDASEVMMGAVKSPVVKFHTVLLEIPA